VRKNRIFEIQINLARQCLFHSEKITALNPLCQCQRLELLTKGLSSPIAPFTRPFSPSFYAGVATAAACLQRRRIHTRML
jgi:hypothetical protein